MTKKKTPPRKTPDREERYMGLAFEISSFSKDPSGQHGAVVISINNKPLGWGYNGPPKSYKDDDLDWSRPNKYKHIIHAEVNAMRHSNQMLLPGSTMYVTGKPCPACMLNIVDAKIQKVIYFSNITYDAGSMQSKKENSDATDEIAKEGDVKLEKFEGNLNWMRDWVMHLDEIGVFAMD